MNDLHDILAAFPALQHSPLVLGLINALLIIYHILTHNRKPKSAALKPRPANKPFLPDELYTPWSEAWLKQQHKQMDDYIVKNKVLPNLVAFKADLQHARVDLKNLVNVYPTHPKSDEVRERIFQVEQMLRAFDKAGKIGPQLPTA